MNYFLFAILFNATLFLSAQDVEDKNASYHRKYDEYKGLKIDGIGGFQKGVHPAKFNTIIYTIGAFPRYSFIAPKDWFSISAGVPLQFGFDLLSTSSGSFVSFTSDFPIVLDVNIGSQSTPDSEYYIGTFAGAGLNYNLSYFLYGNQKLVSHSLGPIVHAGLRWLYNERPIGFRISYLWGLLNNTKKDPAIIYENKNYPTFITFNITYGIL
tara:strand:+ start:2637 stop:3269 length:633 start_codon:yes stop_codon:yes gene_type:complete